MQTIRKRPTTQGRQRGASEKSNYKDNNKFYKIPISLIELERLYHQWYYEKRDGGKLKNLPEKVKTVKKFSDKDANSLTSAIKAWLELHGAAVSRINVFGTYDQKLKRYRHSGSTKGVSDLIAVYQGRYISIEVKFGRDVLSPQQIEYKRSVEAAGALYYVAHNFSDFVTWWDETFGGH